MALVLNEEQVMLKDAAAGFLAEINGGAVGSDQAVEPDHGAVKAGPLVRDRRQGSDLARQFSVFAVGVTIQAQQHLHAGFDLAQALPGKACPDDVGAVPFRRQHGQHFFALREGLPFAQGAGQGYIPVDGRPDEVLPVPFGYRSMQPFQVIPELAPGFLDPFIAVLPQGQYLFFKRSHSPAVVDAVPFQVLQFALGPQKSLAGLFKFILRNDPSGNILPVSLLTFINDLHFLAQGDALLLQDRFQGPDLGDLLLHGLDPLFCGVLRQLIAKILKMLVK